MILLTVLIAAVLSASPAFAGDTDVPLHTSSALSRLEEHGIHIGLTYTWDALHSVRLNPHDATEYRGLLEGSFGLDTDKSGLWKGGEFFLKGQNGHGRGININPGGNEEPISNIEAQDFTQVSEYGIRQKMRDLVFYLGKQDVNLLFCVNDVGSLLMNPSYSLVSTVPMPTFPAPAVGAAITTALSERFSLGIGFFDGGPEVGTLGIGTFREGKNGYFSVCEFAWKPALGKNRLYPGSYKTGLWYHSGDFPATGSAEPETFSGNQGFYLLLNQLLYRPPAAAADQGLGVFFQYGWAPADRNATTQYLGAGLAYKGLNPHRENDTAGLGISFSRIASSERIGEKVHLINIELFYDIYLTSWFSLRPDVQYFHHPGTDAENGLALGFRGVIQF
jgi:porin